MIPNKLKTSSGAVVCGIYGFDKALDANKIMTKLLDGSYHVQTVGTPAQYANIRIYAETLAQRDAADLAAAECAILIADWQGTSYAGYIDGSISWKPFGAKAASGTCKFLIEVTG